jgi:hypothetical protein
VIDNQKEQTMTGITTNHRITRIAVTLATAITLAATVGVSHFG